MWSALESRHIHQRLIAACALALSVLLAWRPSLAVVGGLIGLGVVIAFLRWPRLGLAAVIPVTLLVPFAVSTGTDSRINAAMLIIALLTLLWVLELSLSRRAQLASSRVMLPLAAFGVVAIVSFVIGLQPWLSFVQTASVPTQIGGLAIVLLSLCGFLLVAHRADSQLLRIMTWELLLVGAAYMLIRALELTSTSIFADRGDGSMFWVWVVSLAFSQALLNGKLPLLLRLGLLALTALTVSIGLSNQYWTSGWLPPLVAIGITLVLGSPRLAIPTFALTGLAVLWKLPVVLDLFVTNDYKQYDLLTRTAAWDILLNVVKLEPVLGTGFANYYWYTPFYSILGYNVSFNSHNNYIDVLAQTGIVGLLVLLWLMLALGRLAWHLRERVPEGFDRAFVYGAIGGLGGTAVAAFLGDWLLPFVYNVGMTGFRASILAWLFLGGLVVLERQASRRDQERATTPA